MKAFTLVAFFLLLQAHCAAAGTDSAAWGPWRAPHQSSQKTPADHSAAELSILRYGIGFFQNYISPVDGPRCPMTPTCSTYALQALHRHGPTLAIMLTVDRLLHENNPLEHKHPIPGPDRIRYRDPLENNDFWLPNP